jgi:hypothetical protein
LNHLFGDEIDFENGVKTLRRLIVCERSGRYVPCAIRRLAALTAGMDAPSKLTLSRVDRQKLTVLGGQKDLGEIALSHGGFYVDAVLLALANEKESIWESLAQAHLLKPLPDFPLTGADVIALGVFEGEEVGRILKKIKKEWIENHFVWDRAAALKALSCHFAL